MNKNKLVSILALLSIFGFSVYETYNISYKNGYDDGYYKGSAPKVSTYYSFEQLEPFDCENTSAYQAGARDFPDTTTYNKVHQYYGTYENNAPSNLTLYCQGFDDTARAKMQEQYANDYNNASNEVDSRIKRN